MSQFIKGTVIKVAAWNIFSEIRYNLNLIETAANSKIDCLSRYFTDKGMDPKRLEYYLIKPEKRSKTDVTCDRFITDLEKTSSELLPPVLNKHERSSIVIAHDIYHFCKHQKMQFDLYSSTVDQFSAEFIERVEKEYKKLSRLSIDTDDLIKRINRL